MIKMRQQFVDTVADIMKDDARVTVLLGDIGVFGFRQVFADHPERIYNIGILEQSTVGAAAGLAMTGLIPIVHTIAPFLVERSYEQLKVDFGYQKLNGNFVSVGGSYDYAGLGCTHHCPGDVGILKNIPGMSIVLPGTAKEFDTLFKESYDHNTPAYYRLSETSNATDIEVKFGKANIIKKGKNALIIALGPILDKVLEATKDKDVTIVYYTTIAPFDGETLREAFRKDQPIIICEPYYSGALDWDVNEALKDEKLSIHHIGMPHDFLRYYGSVGDNDKHLGLDTEGIRKKLLNFLKK